MPMFPAAPGRFSITTGWAQIAVSFSPTTRGIRSDAPPGANGTITRTGFCGHDCAFETGGARRTAVRSRSRSMRILLDLGESPLERDRMEPARIGVFADVRDIESLFIDEARRAPRIFPAVSLSAAGR